MLRAPDRRETCLCDKPKQQFIYHAAGWNGSGDASYIDSVILRDRDNTSCGTGCDARLNQSDGVLEERRFYCQNWRADVVAITFPDGTPIEYVRYSAYGEPTVYPMADLNMDGKVDSADLTAWDLNQHGGGTPDMAYSNGDIDFDGYDDPGASPDDSEFFDSYNANLGLSGKGRLSTPAVDNRIGYAGYQWDQVLRGDHVRYRVYLPEIGRWTRRDPLGMLAGTNLFQYVASSPASSVDSHGLYNETGHYYTTYITAIVCWECTPEEAFRKAYYSQLPDEVGSYDAFSIGTSDVSSSLADGYRGPRSMLDENIRRMNGRRISQWIHSLFDGTPKQMAARRACLTNMLKSGTLNDWEEGFVTHALGDAYAHTRPDGSGFPKLIGHAFSGSEPDVITNFPKKYLEYLVALCGLHGDPDSVATRYNRLVRAIDPTNIPADSAGALRHFRDAAVSLGLDGANKGYSPDGDMQTSNNLATPSMDQVQSLIDKMEKACSACGK